MKRFFFRKDQKLKSNDQIRAVMFRKCSMGKGLMRLYVATNDCGYPRFGVSVSKKCGNAVQRNRIKRISREIFRLEQHKIAGNCDYLLIFSPKMTKKTVAAKEFCCKELTFDRFRDIFLECASKLCDKVENR